MIKLFEDFKLITSAQKASYTEFATWLCLGFATLFAIVAGVAGIGRLAIVGAVLLGVAGAFGIAWAAYSDAAKDESRYSRY